MVIPYLRGVVSAAIGVTSLIISQLLILRDETMADLAHRTGIDPGVAVGSVIILASAYFLLDDLLRKSKASNYERLRLMWLTIQNIKFKSFKSIATLTGSGVVIGALFIGTFLTAGALNSITLAEQRLGAEIIVVPADTIVQTQPFYTYPFSFNSYLDESYVYRIASIDGVAEVAGQLFMGEVIFNAFCGVLEKAFFIAISGEDFVVRSILGEELELGVGEVIKGVAVPDRMSFYAALRFFNFTVKRSIAETGTYLDHVIFFSRDTARQVALLASSNKSRISYLSSEYLTGPFNLEYRDGVVNVIYVKVRSGESVEEVALRIRDEIRDVKVLKTSELVSMTKKRLNALTTSFNVINGATIAVSLMLISTVTFMSVNERRRELGLLRAIGASKQFIAKLVTSETVLLTSFGGVGGIMVSWLALYANYSEILRTLKIPFLCPAFIDTVWILMTALGFALLVGIASSLVPAIKISNAEPLKIIKGGVLE